MKVTVEWKGNMLFKGVGARGSAFMDTVKQFNGQESFPSPKEFILFGLAGCTAMDVISILKKMKQEVYAFDIDVDAPVTEEEPHPFTSYKIIYKLWGKGLEKEKVEKAVVLSQEKYCGVSATLAKSGPVSWEIHLFEGEKK